MRKRIITIGRAYGSGGRLIGREVAEKLGYTFYDKELIELAAKECGFSPDFIMGWLKKLTDSDAQQKIHDELVYQTANSEDMADDSDGNAHKYQMLHQLMSADGVTPLSAYCFLLFVRCKFFAESSFFIFFVHIIRRLQFDSLSTDLIQLTHEYFPQSSKLRLENQLLSPLLFGWILRSRQRALPQFFVW